MLSTGLAQVFALVVGQYLLTVVPFPGRETLGTPARMVQRVPGAMPAPLACLERG